MRNQGSRICSRPGQRQKNSGSALDRANSRILLGFLRKKRQPRNNPRKVESCENLGDNGYVGVIARVGGTYGVDLWEKKSLGIVVNTGPRD